MKYAIGIDLGGTKIDGVLVNDSGKIIKKCRILTEAKKGRKTVINNILNVINQLSTRNISGIGIGIPGIAKNGKIIFIPNVPLLNINLKNILERKLKNMVFVENDANCFALAEFMFGACKNKKLKEMVGLIIGTGIGAGIIINKRLYTGSFGGAGELGHNIIDSASRFKCSCGNSGDLESLCSGPSIIRRYKKLKGRIKNPDAEIILKSNENIARQVTKQTYEYLGIGIANIVNTLNPDLIVLGGGVSKSLSLKHISKEVKKYAVPVLARHVKFVKAKVHDPGAIGAACLVFSW